MPLMIEVVDCKDDLEKISICMESIQERFRDMEISIDKALESGENCRKIKQAADNIQDFYKDVMSIYMKIGK